MHTKIALTATMFALLFLAGCASQSPSAATSHTSSSSPTVELDAHGAIDTKLGEPVVIDYPGTSKPAVTLTIDKIQTNLQCTQQFTPPAQNGQYIGLSVTVTTDSDYEKLTGGNSMRIYGNDFSTATSADGPLTPVIGASCVDGEFPFDVPAGATTSGIDVLDVPVGVTSLVWNQSTFAVKVPAREWTVG